MPSISQNMMSKWRNYHLTQQGRYVPVGDNDPDRYRVLVQGEYPDGTVRDTATINCSDLAGEPGPAMFAATAKVLQDYIARVIDPPTLLVAKRKAVDLVPIGRGWSFSSLVGATDTQIDMTGLSGFALARTWHMAEQPYAPARRTAFVLGGTRLRELLAWAQAKHKLSVKTSGTHLGLTVAGAVATGSHGSRLGFGGIQDLVTGLHLVTGPKKSVWIERRSRPVLNDATIATFTTEPPIRDDAVFADVLVHLGGMGIVNGMTIELVSDVGYELNISRKLIGPAWLADIAAGNWPKIAKALQTVSDKPQFYEMTIDPMNWDGNPAVQTLYLPGRTDALQPDGPVTPRSFADLSGKMIEAYLSAKAEMEAAGEPEGAVPGAFDQYCMILEATPDFKHPPLNVPWNKLHPDEITGGYPGALYNASFAVRREEVPTIIPLICEAVRGLDPTFVFTMRFVSKPSGTLAFTRFPETCVIEIDGFSRNAPGFPPQVGDVIAAGAALIRSCLDGANALGRAFDYSMHWGKLGKLGKDKVWHDFGAPGTAGSKIDRWRATRARLLDPAFASVLWNKGLIDYGLLEMPSPAPDDGAAPPPPKPSGPEES